MKLLLFLACLPVAISLCSTLNKPVKNTDTANRNTFFLSSQQRPGAKLFVMYPKEKRDSRYYLFLNRKRIAALNSGAKLIYSFLSEGTLKVSINSGSLYKEQTTLGGSTRTINVKAGKEYYFQINGKGDLEYMANPGKGKEIFDNGTYTSEEIVLNESPSDSLFVP